MLVYPMAGTYQIGTNQPYAQSASLPAGKQHGCATFYINLFDADLCLRRDIGEEIMQRAILNTE